MSMLIVLLLLADFDLPAELALQEEKGRIEPLWAVEVLAVGTIFDRDLRLEDEPGFGANLALELDTGRPTTFQFRGGFLLWETENDDARARPADVHVRRYGIGEMVVFHRREGRLEFGLGMNQGVYILRGGSKSDSSFFFGLEALLGIRFTPDVKLGLVAMGDVALLEFNRSREHLVAMGSLGISFELRF